jgi:SAM-dependent methyltransferase
MSEGGPQESPAETMLRLVQGAWVAQALHVAAVLGIADELRDGAANSDRLAVATGAHPESLYRLLRYLASIGVLAGDDPAGFRLTPVGELLRSDVPGSERERAIAYGTWNYQAWSGLLHTIRTGEPAFDQVFGMPMYDYLARHPAAARHFDRQMQRGESFFAEVPAAYDFSAARTVVDVAGGNGTLLATILTAAPTARGILFDTGHVVAAARGGLRERGVLDRCDLVGGDYFDSVPAGGDVYLLSRVLHNWDDTRCHTLLRNIHEAMRPDGTLLILEHLIPDEGALAPAFALDVNMLTLFGGRERDWPEFRSLLGKAGFELLGRHPMSAGITLLTARHN